MLENDHGIYTNSLPFTAYLVVRERPIRALADSGRVLLTVLQPMSGESADPSSLAGLFDCAGRCFALRSCSWLDRPKGGFVM